MHYNKTLISFVCLFCFISISAQDVKDLPFKQRIFFGGDFGLSIGTNTYINLAPVVGYRITNRLSSGLGPIYMYEKYKYYGFKTSTYGGKCFVSFTVFKDIGQYLNIGIGNITFHTENEILNIEKLYQDITTGRIFGLDERIWIDNWLIGGGLSQPLGERGGINIFALWDITQNSYSPHTNPIIRVGFYF